MEFKLHSCPGMEAALSVTACNRTRITGHRPGRTPWAPSARAWPWSSPDSWLIKSDNVTSVVLWERKVLKWIVSRKIQTCSKSSICNTDSTALLFMSIINLWSLRHKRVDNTSFRPCNLESKWIRMPFRDDDTCNSLKSELCHQTYGELLGDWCQSKRLDVMVDVSKRTVGVVNWYA